MNLNQLWRYQVRKPQRCLLHSGVRRRFDLKSQSPPAPFESEATKENLLPDPNGPKETQFEDKGQSRRIYLIKQFGQPAAKQNAKSLSCKPRSLLKSEHVDLDDSDNDLFLNWKKKA